ncbi:MAG: hypothetical protein R3190_04040 [Thermoanaerobaculia bacterium]|nr:hypothetical protein [Thermoanaerobaculia bacterium]
MTTRTLAPVLAILLLLAFAAGPALAAPEKGKRCSDGIDNDGDGLVDAADPDCGGDDGGSGGGGQGKCQIDFVATFADAVDDGVRSDGGGSYPAATGSGPGFRLDTNGKPQLEKPNDDRKVILDFGANQGCAGGWADDLGFCNSSKGINMVFDLTFAPLDLCSLDPGGAAGEVSLHIAFLAADGDRKTLTYGCLAAPEGPPLGTSVPAMVSRESASTWHIAGDTACLRDGGLYDPIVDGTDADPLVMPFLLTIVDTDGP